MMTSEDIVRIKRGPNDLEEIIDKLTKQKELLKTACKKAGETIKTLTKNKTTIVIAHRLSTILNSNNIYVINSGGVVDNGKHEDLIEKSELYKSFYEKQIQK